MGLSPPRGGVAGTARTCSCSSLTTSSTLAASTAIPTGATLEDLAARCRESPPLLLEPDLDLREAYPSLSRDRRVTSRSRQAKQPRSLARTASRLVPTCKRLLGTAKLKLSRVGHPS